MPRKGSSPVSAARTAPSMAVTCASWVRQTGTMSQPACMAMTAARSGVQRSATAFISRSSVNTTPSYFRSPRRMPSTIGFDSEAGTSGSSSG